MKNKKSNSRLNYIFVLIIGSLLNTTVFASDEHTSKVEVASNYKGVNVITFFGYDNAVELKNKNVRVIIAPDFGGKIMHYSVNGKNIIMTVEQEKGWQFTPGGSNRTYDSGARFDFGHPEIHKNRELYKLAKWNVKVLGDRSVLLTSQVDPKHGLKFTRSFTLSANNSSLEIYHTMQNLSSDKTISAWFWTRMFAKGGGIFFKPITPPVRFPLSYVVKLGNAIASRPPADENIVKETNHIAVIDQPKTPKLGFDSFSGWHAYLSKNNLLFIGSFPVYPNRPYGDIIGGNYSLYYNNNFRGHSVAELEPIGPLEHLKKGEVAHFKEIWTLQQYPFPKNRKDYDFNDIERIATEVINR